MSELDSSRKDPLPRRRTPREPARRDEALVVQLHPQPCGRRGEADGGRHAGREHNDVEFLFSNRSRVVYILEDEVTRRFLPAHRRRQRPHAVDAL